MGGHGTTLGGAIVDSGKFDWKAQARRFPMFNEPDASYHGLIYTEHFGAAAYIARCRSVYQRTTGAVLSPLSAFLLLQGIETVALRVERHVDNARRVAEFLRQHPSVAWVNYAGFADNPYHALAHKYLGGRACSLLTFGVAGGLAAAKDFYDALGLFKRLVNMGDAKSLACHPASTTHRQMSARGATQGRRAAGNDQAQRRHRAHRRHHRRSRSGAGAIAAAPLGLDRGRIGASKSSPDDAFSGHGPADIGSSQPGSNSTPRIASPSASSTTCRTRRSRRRSGNSPV